MKCITVRHPHAWAIVHMGKDIENRSWATKYRGPLLIHAASTMSAAEYGDFAEFFCADIGHGHMPSPSQLRGTLGHIIGIVDVVDCVEKSKSPWFFGEYGFVLRNARPLIPVKWKGKLNLFDVPGDALMMRPPLVA